MAMDPNQTLPSSQYMLPQAEDYRRKMAMELMYGKGQTQQPEMKHWTQLLGNIGNSYAGNKMFNQANDLGRKSDIHDASQFEGGMFGGQKPPIPGVGGPAPFQASGPMPFSGGTPSPTPSVPSPGGPPVPPPQGMGGTPPMPPPQIPGMQPRPPMQFPGAGGLPQPEQWPQSLFNPQG